MVENAVGARLQVLCQERGMNLFYWRDRQEEVDYIIQRGNELLAIEVKSSVERRGCPSLSSFLLRHKSSRGVVMHESVRRQKTTYGLPLIESVSLEEFFKNPKKSIGL